MGRIPLEYAAAPGQRHSSSESLTLGSFGPDDEAAALVAHTAFRRADFNFLLEDIVPPMTWARWTDLRERYRKGVDAP